MKHKWLLAGAFAFFAGLFAPQAVDLPASRAEAAYHTMRFNWDVVPGAVQYELVLLKGPEDTKENVVSRHREIFTAGATIDISGLDASVGNYYWKVCGQDFHGNYIGRFTEPRPLSEGTEENPVAPKPTTQFGQMDYMPLYPVFSWIPQAYARQHEVRVCNASSGACIRTLQAGENDIYEDSGYTYPGRYYWQVRSLNADGYPMSDWSEPSYFEIGSGATPVAALGDSITHGGGAVSVPPGYLLYDWETYSPVPVKNLGYSGNTTAEMLARFESDVLPWQPRVLVIMGGVNDFRLGVQGWETVANLEAMKAKCAAYGIIPVFVTATPINPEYMTHRIAGIEVPPYDWQEHMKYINGWVLSQQYSLDVASALQDGSGCLRRDYTTDGLHPDYYGKKFIGESIGSYLQQHFGWIVNGLQKKS